MGIVDRGRRDGRRPRSRWPEDREWPPRDRAPEPPPPRSAAPTATYLIMAICIGVFAYGEATETSRVLVEDYGYLPSRLGEGGTAGYLGLVTHMFLHGGWLHLIVNMIVLWSFGRGLEPVMGAFRFIVLYLATGVLAALAHGFVNELSNVILIGASGAIAGVLGAYLVLYPRARILSLVPIIFFFTFIEVPALLFLLFWFASQVFSGVLSLGGASGSGIAWWAHIGGFVFGVLMVSFFARRTIQRYWHQE